MPGEMAVRVRVGEVLVGALSGAAEVSLGLSDVKEPDGEVRPVAVARVVVTLRAAMLVAFFQVPFGRKRTSRDSSSSNGYPSLHLTHLEISKHCS